MDVDDAVVERADEVLREDAHVLWQDKVIGLVSADDVHQLAFVLVARLSFVRHVMVGDTEFFRQVAEEVVVKG